MLDEEGLIEDIVARERNIAHRLIEEFMLLANETVAAHLEQHEMPALYRIHEPPDPLKVLEFDEFVTSLGYSLERARRASSARCTFSSSSSGFAARPRSGRSPS